MSLSTPKESSAENIPYREVTVEVNGNAFVFKKNSDDSIEFNEKNEVTGRIKDMKFIPDNRTKRAILENEQNQVLLKHKFTKILADYYCETGFLVFKESINNNGQNGSVFVMKKEVYEQCCLEDFRGYACGKACENALKAKVIINHLGQVVIDVDNIGRDEILRCEDRQLVYYGPKNRTEFNLD